MKIRLLAFATASDLVGKGPQDLELDAGARLSDLRLLLQDRHPTLEALWPRLAVAVDGALVQGDPELQDGAEVALLPPVSGGAPAKAQLVDGPIDVAALERAVAAADCGAVVLFLGTVRDHHGGRAVARLDYSAYRPLAESTLASIVADLEASEEPIRAAIVHRLGSVPIGEPSVVIAVASPHRQAAYDASRLALERLKKEVPIWKREHYADGDVAWREEEPLPQPGYR
ncbi:MAG: molybdenum cofactor biosynthesis protein MoaE [Acidobacteriota bacterium]